MIQTENLSKRFKNTLAVENLSIHIHEGEVFGFLGPNGAGKTTTVRMLSSLISPTSGTAIVNGFQVGQKDTDIRRTVGILTETPGMYDNLSAEFNLEIYANLYEVKDPKGQVEKYLRMLGLWDRRMDEAGTFSKGMKQKLAIARTLLHEPRILFLDEPTPHWDPKQHCWYGNSSPSCVKKAAQSSCAHTTLMRRIGCVIELGFKTQLLALDTPQKLRSQLFGRKVVFHLLQADPALEKLASSLPFVTNARLVDNKLVVTLDDPDIHNPEIIRKLVGAGAEIQFVGELRHSLEDVYMQLVKNVD